MKKTQKEEEGDDTNSIVSVGPPDPRPPDDRIGPPTLFHRKLRQMIPWIPFLVQRLRLQNQMPLEVRAWFPSGEDETAVPFPTDLGSHPSNRTSFSTSFKIHGGVYRIYPKSAQRAYGSDEQKPTSGVRKGELTRRRSYAPVPAPLFISEGIFFFLRTHPLEVRWSWNCGAFVIPVVFSDPWTPSLRISPILRPATSVVPIEDTKEENTADKEIGPAGP